MVDPQEELQWSVVNSGGTAVIVKLNMFFMLQFSLTIGTVLFEVFLDLSL